MSLNIGDQAPAFSGKDTNDKPIALVDYRGKQNVFLVFYPLAFSPVCSVQLPRYNQNLDGFRSRDTVVIAVSVDSAYSQKAFCESMGGIDFPVVSDLNLETAKQYGVALDTGFTTRAEFAIDKSGKIGWMNIEKSAGDDTPTMDDIFSALDAL